jgi:hypothetical protein
MIGLTPRQTIRHIVVGIPMMRFIGSYDENDISQPRAFGQIPVTQSNGRRRRIRMHAFIDFG